MKISELEKELKEVRELMVDLERPNTRNLMELETIDTIRKALTYRFKGLLAEKAKKVAELNEALAKIK